jgi:hypothetical protein
MEVNPKRCPICNKNNQCGNELGKSTCWCSAESFPEEIFTLLPEDKLHKACICKVCLEKIAKQISVH